MAVERLKPDIAGGSRGQFQDRTFFFTLSKDFAADLLEGLAILADFGHQGLGRSKGRNAKNQAMKGLDLTEIDGGILGENIVIIAGETSRSIADP
jgi:hypothetical protein